MTVIRALACAGIVLASTGPASGQQSVDYGSVSGRVTDQTGAVIPGAQIAARHTGTNVVIAAVADGRGRFRFPYLRIGPHDITAVSPGFKPAVRHVSISAGSAFELNLVLPIDAIDTDVTVVADTVALEAARSQISGTVHEQEIGRLPLNGRNFLELGLLIPGVAPANIPATQLFPETSAVPGLSLSVAGQRNLSNNFIVDGLSANDDAAGLSGMTYGVDAIEQFQVVTSGGQAELGRALGGYINVVTRSGTNVWRGSAYSFLRDDELSAANHLSGTNLPMRQWQYGASAGGRLVKDRTFYFANVEQRRLDQHGLVTITDANAAAINARLEATGYPGPRVETGLFRSPVRSTNLFAKLDDQAGGRDRIAISYGLYDVTAENARGAGGLSAASASSRLDNLDQTIAIHNTLTVSARTVLESRVQAAHGRLNAPPSDPVGPLVSIAGVATFGTLSNAPTARVNTMYQLVSNLSHQTGDHALRAGVDAVYNRDAITFPRAARGSYTFGSLADFLTGTYTNAGFTQTFGADEVRQQSTSIGTYMQDEWKAMSRLTLNLGLRYDLQLLETLHTDLDNLAPRVGFAWRPLDGGGTVVRGSAGIFFDRVPLRAVANALLSAGNTTDLARVRQVNVSLSPGQSGAPVFPAILETAVPSITLPSLTTMDRNLELPFAKQAGIEIERQLGAVTVSAAYQYLHGSGLLMNINQNVPSCVPAGGNNGCRPNAAYANNPQYTAAGQSSYHGLHLSIVQRPARWGSYRVSYTLSKAMNDVGEFFFSTPIDPGDLSKDWARADSDQRHRLVALGTAQLPLHLEASAMLQAYSAAPFNITSGVTTIQGTAGRPIVEGSFIERNAGHGDPFLSVNARIGRTFAMKAVKVEATVEGFNLTNHRNVLARNGTFGTGSYPSSPAAGFGAVTAVGDPRSFQLGLRVRF